MAEDYLPPKEFLVECFAYGPETGEFRWKNRPDAHFSSPAVAQMWNTQNAGRAAFLQLSGGYKRAEIRFCGRRVRLRACRVAWKIFYGGEPEQIDHIDNDRANDAISNLRAATQQQQNQFNRAGWSGRELPKGVYRDGNAVRAAIWLDGKSVKLGRFSSPAAAHEAYCRAAQEHHGEFFNPGRKPPQRA